MKYHWVDLCVVSNSNLIILEGNEGIIIGGLNILAFGGGGFCMTVKSSQIVTNSFLSFNTDTL